MKYGQGTCSCASRDNKVLKDSTEELVSGDERLTEKNLLFRSLNENNLGRA